MGPLAYGRALVTRFIAGRGLRGWPGKRVIVVPKAFWGKGLKRAGDLIRRGVSDILRNARMKTPP